MEKRKSSRRHQAIDHVGIPFRHPASTDRFVTVAPIFIHSSTVPSTNVNIKGSGSNSSGKGFIDFLAQSPFEIFCHIVSYLDTYTAIQCTQVSGTWRTKLLSYHGLWRQMEIRYPYKRQYRIPSTLLHHTRKLVIHDQVTASTNCTEFLRIHVFKNLESLELCFSAGHGANMRSPELLYNTLTYVGQTLTELRIDWPRIQDTRISLSRILSACQILTTIKVIAWSIKDCVVSRKTLLSQMERHSRQAIQPLFQLWPLIWRCPHLLHLEVNGCELDEEILPVLSNCCPELMTLITRKTTQLLYEDVTVSALHSSSATTRGLAQQHYNTINAGRPGELQCLVLHSIRSVIPLRSRLEKSQNSLRILSLLPRGGSEKDWTQLSTLALPRLTFLHIKVSDITTTEFLRDHFPAMLRGYDNLETLVLESYSDQYQQRMLTDVIFGAVAELPNLVCLRLSHIDIRGRGFSQLLHNHSVCRRTSSLRELALHHCTGVTTSILHSVAANNNLKKLSIYQPDQQVATSDVTSLVYHQMHQLESLELGLMQLTDESAADIAGCKNLAFLLLYKMNGAGKRRVDQLLKPFIKQVVVQWR
ncbi:hypothetical protein BDB00DRAFT_844538 [Zychaea mexicana]|uniref:uncharacterized protein n=1 Tax=Zychaea mexicana TaxID=64656 RepID=UPI0022FE0FDF|nr:uncharacterized protein BDB00DRAFT_844538 [Zychaea mexicana]KAI9489260.1 hypothetical protein BDB00DRAFT_844538 [Zychaea mexicana]